MCTASAQDSWLISEFTDMLRDTQTMTSTYAYTPLDLSKDSIRLLRLCKGDARTEIRCELVESFLSESEGLPYEALSYTWGGELTSDSPRILLNGVDFPITKNLFEALCSLRLGNQDRLMWVDALCINQDDHREKGHQVGQMRFVYRNAETVLIWLGPSSRNVDDLMNAILCLPAESCNQDMMAEWRQCVNQQQQTMSNMKTLWSASTELFEDSGKATAYGTHMSTLEKHLESPWFRRVWILQEVANARKATIICGAKSVSSRVFSTMPYLMGLKKMHPHTKAVMDVMPGPLRKQSWWNNDRRLITLLIKFHGSQAIQQHDRIYALFGIASDAPDVPITYGCPFQQVFAQVVSILTVGDVGQSHSFGDRSAFRFPEVFSGPYVYTPLDQSKGSIRLLSLCEGEESDEIRCGVVECSLSDGDYLPYEALSYTWGGGLPDNPLTRNLFDALFVLRLKHEVRYLWIDALCINQMDDYEKAHQVGQMKDVYQKAERRKSVQNLNFAWDMITIRLPDAKVAELRSSLTELTQRSWFRRVWIIQEVGSARVASVLCGDKSISSSIFSAMPFIMKLQPDPQAQAVLDIMPGPLREHSWWNADRRLLKLLAKFIDSEATREHDRIYALLGVASDAPNVPTDYGCPFQTVVARTASLIAFGTSDQSFLLQDERSLD
ncbi:HET-domain-containing protein [Apiospora saccharicola]|uniref:HET-domain-containing protein n=1 Tax=Apiospora saccharicola TaxID=335842 RepID=A0ABR1W4U2_9PEZI